MRKDEIIYENRKRFVVQLGIGHYEIYENSITHAKRVATVHYSSEPDKALSKAREYVNKEKI